MTTEKAWERRKRLQDEYLAANPYQGDPFARLPLPDHSELPAEDCVLVACIFHPKAKS